MRRAPSNGCFCIQHRAVGIRSFAIGPAAWCRRATHCSRSCPALWVSSEASAQTFYTVRHGWQRDRRGCVAGGHPGGSKPLAAALPPLPPALAPLCLVGTPVHPHRCIAGQLLCTGCHPEDQRGCRGARAAPPAARAQPRPGAARCGRPLPAALVETLPTMICCHANKHARWPV